MRQRLWFVWLAIVVSICALLLVRQFQKPSEPQTELSREPVPQPANRSNTVVAATPSVAKVPETNTIPAQGPDPVVPAEQSVVSAPSSKKTKAVIAPPLVSHTPDFSDPPPDVVVDNMRRTFRLFASKFGANPVGTNPEITKALNGDNPKQTMFVRPEDGLRINEAGELIDPWGTPFFFHQLSAKEMEIHSAGPDRVMWTGDDLVTK